MRQIAEEVYKSKQSVDVYSSFQTSSHNHNGVDAPRVSESDLIPSNKYRLTGIFPAGDGNLVLTGVSNPSSIAFYGVATSGGSGGRAVVNGIAYLGSCFEASSDNLAQSSPIDILQSSNGLYINTSNVNTAFPLFSSLFLVFVETNAPAVVATVEVVRYDNQSITLDIHIVVGWQLVGSFFIV